MHWTSIVPVISEECQTCDVALRQMYHSSRGFPLSLQATRIAETMATLLVFPLGQPCAVAVGMRVEVSAHYP